ncbi:MAG: L,D-transpeptidase family protein [Bacteroidales bacterium]|nr:L,D-transpeptidase family protein [Bacteroidales bacterium]
MSSGMTTFTMEDSGCYEGYRAAVRSGDLTQELELYNSYAKCNITFDFDDRKKVVSSDMIVDWLMTYPDGTVLTDSEGKAQFDRNGVATFVAQMAAETDTVGKPRHFYATLDGWIDVPWNGDSSSTYGWQINQEETVNQLIGLMQEGKTVTVEPEYSRRGYTRKTDDIGNTYVEADISAQHFWVYINGQMVLDDDFVSGTETNPDRRTPRGVCTILSRNTNVVLGTMAVQGYECPVSYWMPFNWLGCGFHDLSRGAYGGSIYMYNGSHGCLNLRYSTAKALYETVETGMPVLVHD